MHNKHVKVLACGLVLFALVSVLVAACARPGTTPEGSTSTANGNSGSAGGASGQPTVHMGNTNFIQNTITVPKGSSLKLVDDVAVLHIIQNGTWNNGSAQNGAEPGAPKAQLTFQGNDSNTIGPFTTAGTFKYYCTVHPGMNLTVTVQ